MLKYKIPQIVTLTQCYFCITNTREAHKNCPFYLSDDAKFPLDPEYWFR